MPAKGHRQPPEARAKIATARLGRRHSEATKRAISQGVKISHAIRTIKRAEERRRAQLHALGWTDAEIDEHVRTQDEDADAPDTEEWRASWRECGATDAQINAVIARVKAEDEKWRARWRPRGVTDAQINEAIARVKA